LLADNDSLLKQVSNKDNVLNCSYDNRQKKQIVNYVNEGTSSRTNGDGEHTRSDGGRNCIGDLVSAQGSDDTPYLGIEKWHNVKEGKKKFHCMDEEIIGTEFE